MEKLLMNPMVTFLFFFAIAFTIYFLAGRFKETGEYHPTRHKTYTGGEEIAPPEGKMQYQAFYWLALLFSILHMAALVISTLPLESIPFRLALLYLLGAGASVFVLSEEEH